jgi:hypothetical protein
MVHQLLIDDSPIPALGAAVASGPRNKAASAEVKHKSAQGKGHMDGPVSEYAIRFTIGKNSKNKTTCDAAATATTFSSPYIGIPSSSAFTAFQDSSVDQPLSIAKR